MTPDVDCPVKIVLVFNEISRRVVKFLVLVLFVFVIVHFGIIISILQHKEINVKRFILHKLVYTLQRIS